MYKAAFCLREAVIDDAPDILAIYQDGDDFALSGDRQKDIGLLDVMEWIESTTPQRPMLVVTVDHKGIDSPAEDCVVAWGALEPFYGLPSFDLAAEVSVYTLPKWRGKGAASAFIEYLVAHREFFQFTHLVAYIYTKNHISQLFFKKQGFDTWGVLPKIASNKDGYDDVYLLGKVF